MDEKEKAQASRGAAVVIYSSLIRWRRAFVVAGVLCAGAAAWAWHSDRAFRAEARAASEAVEKVADLRKLVKAKEETISEGSLREEKLRADLKAIEDAGGKATAHGTVTTGRARVGSGSVEGASPSALPETSGASESAFPEWILCPGDDRCPEHLTDETWTLADPEAETCPASCYLDQMLGPLEFAWLEFTDPLGKKVLSVADPRVFSDPPKIWTTLPDPEATYTIDDPPRQPVPLRTLFGLGGGVLGLQGVRSAALSQSCGFDDYGQAGEVCDRATLHESEETDLGWTVGLAYFPKWTAHRGKWTEGHFGVQARYGQAGEVRAASLEFWYLVGLGRGR